MMQVVTLSQPPPPPIPLPPSLALCQAVDDAGHDKCLARKAEWLEKCDAMILQVRNTYVSFAIRRSLLEFIGHRS